MWRHEENNNEIYEQYTSYQQFNSYESSWCHICKMTITGTFTSYTTKNSLTTVLIVTINVWFTCWVVRSVVNNMKVKPPTILQGGITTKAKL